MTWASRTITAPWAARDGHTSVVDAAGAIYVIGGFGGVARYYKDVWASTDGGARPDRVGGWVGGYTRGVLRVLLGTLWHYGTTWGCCGTWGLLKGT